MESELKENPVVAESITETIRQAEVVVEKMEEVGKEIAKIVEVVDTAIERNSWFCSFFDWMLSAKTRLHSLAKPEAPSSKESN